MLNKLSVMDQDPDTSHSEETSLTDNNPDIPTVEEYNEVIAKQRASVLWLLSKAYMPKIPSELFDPCYADHEGNERLKPQIVHALANAELYCLALANIYADPNYHNLNHHGILQVLMRKGIDVIEPPDVTLTETVLVQTAPIRMVAHMAVIEGIMALFVKEVLIPEKVMEVVSRFAVIDPENELPYDSEEAGLLWINKCCIKLKHRIEAEMGNSSNKRSDSSPVGRFYSPMIALAQDLGDLSDGCCLASLLSLYCPKYFRWQDIRLNDPMSLADTVHNLQLVQKFCQNHLPQDIYCLTLEDMVYLHPSILPNVLTFVADLMYIFEIRPPKHICRPGVREDNRFPEDIFENHNGQIQSPNYRRQNVQQSATSPVQDQLAHETADRDDSIISPRSNGSCQKPQRSPSSRKLNAQEDRTHEGPHALRYVHSMNFGEDFGHMERYKEFDTQTPASQSNYLAEEDEEIAGYFVPQYPGQKLMTKEDNQRNPSQHPSDDAGQYKVYRANNTFTKASSNKSSAKWTDAMEAEAKSGIKKSPSSYEIHQLSPSKQNVGPPHGYLSQRSQSEIDIPHHGRKFGSLNHNSKHILETASEQGSDQHTTKASMKGPSGDTRKNRNSFHEVPRHSALRDAGKQRKPIVPRRNNSDFFLHESTDMECRSNRLSGSQTWRKPKDLFARTEFDEQGESSDANRKEGSDQDSAVNFANLSKRRSDSGSAINITYMHHDREHQTGTYKPTRPAFLHITGATEKNDARASPSSAKVNSWLEEDEQKSFPEDVDTSAAAQMLDIKLQLEEKRHKIEQEKNRLEEMTKKQRERVGKAAFLQAVKTANAYDSSGGRKTFSVDDLTEDLDSVRRKWLEKKTEESHEENMPRNQEVESPSEEIQYSIDQLNCSLTDLQSDISKLTQQQDMIHKMLGKKQGQQQTPQSNESYFLHEGGSALEQEPSRWAEPVKHPNQPLPQQVERPEISHVGRGHWGQPVMPFTNMPQNPHLPPAWQQQGMPMYMNQPHMEPQVMAGQPMNMHNQMYDHPAFVGTNHPGFSLHPQHQMKPPNYGMQMPSPYQSEQPPYYPSQYPPFTNAYSQSNYNTMQQNMYSVGGNDNQMQYQAGGFHLHRSPSANYVSSRQFTPSPSQMNDIFHQSKAAAMPRSQSKTDVLTFIEENPNSLTDDFGRHMKNTNVQQHSPPNRPVLGKTFRVSKPKMTSPTSPNPDHSAQAKAEEQTQEVPPPLPTSSPPSSEPADKGFYISFDEADQPRKPKPKLKPKHLKARSQQRKLENESRKWEIDSGGTNVLKDNQNFSMEQTSVPKQHPQQSQDDEEEDSFGNEEKENTRKKIQATPAPKVPKAPGVGFMVGTGVDQNKEIEMTRRKEMIMMMSLQRRAEQEAKRNDKQQEYLKKREDERIKSEQAERKKEDEKLRRQLILEQYRQRKAAEDEEGTSGGRDDHRSAKGATMTRPKPRSTSASRAKPRSSQPTFSSKSHDLSSPSSLDSPIGRGSQYNLTSGYHDDVSSEHSYTHSPQRSQSYPHSSPISPSSYPSSPGPLLSGMLSNRSRGTPSDGLSDTSSTISSAWASEYSGPKLFVKPSTKSNRGIIINAINTVLAGAVNAETKRKVLEEMDRSDGKHFLILFRDAGCQFRALYSYNPETEEVIKMLGIGPRIVTNKMMDRFYKYNSGGKSFTQIHTKHLTATIDAITIQNSLWQAKKTVPLKRDYL